MIIKLKNVGTMEAHTVVRELTDYLMGNPIGQGQKYLDYRDLGFSEYPGGRTIDLWEMFNGVPADITSSGLPVWLLNEVKRSPHGWNIVLEAQEEVFQSELFESEYAGGPPAWKVPRYFLHPVLDILFKARAPKWQVTIESDWATTKYWLFDNCRTEGNPKSWLISPTDITALFDGLKLYPQEKGVMVRAADGRILV